MRVEQLYYFLDVAQTQSITKSASNLCISPQGLSQAIAALEKEYGVVLFDRTKGGMTLNADGSLFKRFAQELCESFRSFEGEVATLRKKRPHHHKEKIRLFLPPLIIWSECLKSMLDDLEKNFPGIEFLITEKNLDEIFGSVCFAQTESNCIGLVSIPDFRMNEVLAMSSCACDSILEMPILAKVHKNSLHAQKRLLSKRDVSMMPIACFNEPIMESIVKHMMQDYGEPNIVLRGSTNELLALQTEAVVLSVGMAVSGKDLVSIPITDTINVRIASICPDSYLDQNAAILASIRHFLVEYYPLFRLNSTVM